MISVNEFNGNEVTAAYTVASEDPPKGRVVGQSGNALLISDGALHLVVSRPKSEGDIRILFHGYDWEEIPVVDLPDRF